MWSVLQHYQGDISELELYFVVVINEYGEQTEEDLLPGGKDTRVTNENVITYIHLIANHRLNYQVIVNSLMFFICILLVLTCSLNLISFHDRFAIKVYISCEVSSSLFRKNG